MKTICQPCWYTNSCTYHTWMASSPCDCVGDTPCGVYKPLQTGSVDSEAASQMGYGFWCEPNSHSVQKSMQNNIKSETN